MLVADQDGDGVDELWFADDSQDTPSETLYRFTPQGEWLVSGSAPNTFTGLYDVTGDGILDATLFATGHFDSPIGFIEGAPGLIEGPLQVTELLPNDDGVGAFADVTGDGISDFFSNPSYPGRTRLLVGDGNGGFAPSIEMDQIFEGRLAVTETADPSIVVLSP